MRAQADVQSGCQSGERFVQRQADLLRESRRARCRNAGARTARWGGCERTWPLDREFRNHDSRGILFFCPLGIPTQSSGGDPSASARSCDPGCVITGTSICRRVAERQRSQSSSESAICGGQLFCTTIQYEKTSGASRYDGAQRTTGHGAGTVQDPPSSISTSGPRAPTPSRACLHRDLRRRR